MVRPWTRFSDAMRLRVKRPLLVDVLLGSLDDESAAMDYYERAAPGLGQEFLDEIERTVCRILLQPKDR